MRQLWLGVVLAGVVLLADRQRLSAQDKEGMAEVVALHRRAEALKKAGKLQEATKAYEKLLEKVKEVYGANHAWTAFSLNELAVLYQARGQHAKAEPLYQRSLKIFEAKLGKDHPEVATSLNNLAGLYRDLGQYAKAEPLFKRSLEIREAKLGKDHSDVAQSLNNLALLYKAMGQYAKAEPLYQRSLKIFEAKLGKDHPEVATSLHNLAGLYRAMGQYAKAEPLYQRSLVIKEAKLGKDHPDVATSLNNLAALYADMGQYAKAEPLYQRSLKIWEAKLGKDHPSVALSLNNLALLYKAMGQYAKAEPLYQRSLKIFEAKLGKDHPHVADSLNNLAVLYWNMGQYAKAEPLFKRSLAIWEAKLGKDHPSVATVLNNLAMLYSAMGQSAKAEPLFKRSLEIREAKLGKDHPDVAISLNNLASLYKAMGQYAKAEPLYKRSLAIYEAKLGKDHPDLARSLNNLAVLYKAMGQYAKAEPLYQRSLKIWEAKLGKDHPDVATSLNNLAALYAGKDESGEAGRLFDRARRGARRHLASVLPALSDPDKAAFFRNTTARNNLEMALSLGLGHKRDATLAGLSAAWLLNGKGADQESLASSLLLSRQSSDPALGKRAQQLLSVRQQLARLTFATPRPGQDKQRLLQIEELSGKEQELARTLRLAGSNAAPPPWVELADLRKTLPNDAVLIDIAHFDVFDFKAKPGKRWQAARYVAWITPKRGNVRVIDLGLADKIDEAIKQVREDLQNAQKQIKAKGETKSEQALGEHLETLSALVLKPLLPHIGTSKRWLLSPDGNLWLLPWEALLLKDGSYAIEKHEISYFTSGRDVLPRVAAKVKVRAPLVLADPDFDLDPDKASQQAKRLLGHSENEDGTRALSSGLRLGAVRRLKGTAAEARGITPSLKAFAGVAPRVHTGSEALEAVFKAAKHPRVVVLCTHGFFLPDQEIPRDEPGKPRAKKRWENPLLRCGLLLAGCNNAAKAGNGDDGVLTGLEVVGTDLRGCEMVVLSACETGVGEVQTGEGVAGLRQAFLLAGADSVVSTLWQVPDKQSARLMAFFFRNLGKKMSKAEALRAAKLQIIAERRDDYAAAHPFFWAAFTLTGGEAPAPTE